VEIPGAYRVKTILQPSKSLSFPNAPIGNPDETMTGPRQKHSGVTTLG
jgi:hypothetical protein